MPTLRQSLRFGSMNAKYARPPFDIYKWQTFDKQNVLLSARRPRQEQKQEQELQVCWRRGISGVAPAAATCCKFACYYLKLNLNNEEQLKYKQIEGTVRGCEWDEHKESWANINPWQLNAFNEWPRLTSKGLSIQIV